MLLDATSLSAYSYDFLKERPVRRLSASPTDSASSDS